MFNIAINMCVRVQKKNVNIAGGTTDPKYWVYNLNYVFDWIEFVFIQAAEKTQDFNLKPLVRCASSNVCFIKTAIQCGSDQMVPLPNLATRWHHLH